MPPGSCDQEGRHAVSLVSWNFQGGLQLQGQLGGVRDKEALVSAILQSIGDKYKSGAGPSIIFGQETEVSSDADKEHVKNTFRELGYKTYHSIKRRKPSKRVTGSGVLVALNTDTFREDEVSLVVDVVVGKVLAVELSGRDGRALSVICVHAPGV